MRAVLIILSIAALMFIGGILWMFATKEGSPLSPIKNNTSTISDESLALETLKYQIKNEEKLNQLQAQLDRIAGNSPQIEIKPTGETSTGSTETGTVVPVSAKFLSRIMPTIELTITKNDGIFGLDIFNNTTYSTYTDDRFGMTLVASMIPYERFLSNFQAIDSTLYTVNETKSFPFDSFYVNPASSDTLVRLVFSVEKQTLLVSFPKTKFDDFKKLILRTDK